MASSHNEIVKTTYKLCKNYVRYRKVYADHISEDYQPLFVHSIPKKGERTETYEYYPDIWAQYKQGRIDVFEVWDNQTSEQCVEDVMLSALVDGIKYIHVICLQESQYELAKKLVKIVYDSIFDEDGDFLVQHKPCVILVPPELEREKLRSFLSKKLQL